MKRIVALVLVALCLGCTERVVDRPVRDNDCWEALEFANWVKKAHPQVWHEYYTRICRKEGIQ